MEQKRGRGKERGNKKGRGNKNFKKGGKLDQGVGALKREGGGGEGGGAGTPLQTMV